MTDVTAPASPAAEQAAVSNTVLAFTLPHIDGELSFDCATIPGDTRLELLKKAVRDYIANRVNSTAQRHAKEDGVAAWVAYDEAQKADSFQTAVAQPTGERPAPADVQGALDRAFEALRTGEIRKQDGEPKSRKRADPLIRAVTQAVVADVFKARKANDSKYTYPMATKEVGADGIAYLNGMIETKVAEGGDRAALEKARDSRYVNPAKTMLGLNTTKALSELPSLL